MQVSNTHKQQAKRQLAAAVITGASITKTINSLGIATRGANAPVLNALLFELVAVRDKAEQAGLRFHCHDQDHRQNLQMSVRQMNAALQDSFNNGNHTRIASMATTLSEMFEDLRPLLRADHTDVKSSARGAPMEVHVISLTKEKS